MEIAEDGFRPVERETVVDAVIGQIKGLMRSREFVGGKPLPGERHLAKRLRVSRASVREAIRTLSHMGVLDTRHGRKTQVAASGSDVLRAPLEFLFLLDQPSVAEIHETRELLEVFLAGRAAERRTDEDLQHLRQALDEMRAELGAGRPMTEPDLRFHQAVARAAHNRLTERIMNCLAENLRGVIHAAWPGVGDLQASYQLHENVFEAIRKRDASEARRIMQGGMDMMVAELRAVKLLP